MEIITAKKTAVLYGATGLVGQELLRRLLDHPAYDRVIAPGRRKVPGTHPKLEALVVDFTQLGKWTQELAGHDVFIALGTTIKKAGSAEAFRRVDYQFVLDAAAVGKAGGANQVLLVSSAGADPTSSVLYPRTKGEAEEAVKALEYWATYIFRPGVLIGDREEFRFGEKVMIGLSKVAALIKPDLLGDYSGTRAGDLAGRMIALAQRVEPGVHVVGAASLAR